MRSLRPEFGEPAKNVRPFYPLYQAARHQKFYHTVEELAGEGDHAVHEVGLDEGAADVAFAGLVEGSRDGGTIGEEKACHGGGGF